MMVNETPQVTRLMKPKKVLTALKMLTVMQVNEVQSAPSNAIFAHWPQAYAMGASHPMCPLYFHYSMEVIKG